MYWWYGGFGLLFSGIGGASEDDNRTGGANRNEKCKKSGMKLFVEGGEGEGTLLAYQIAMQIQIFAPLLIIFRIAQGNAWSSKTCSKVTTITASQRKGASISVIHFESTVDPGQSQGTMVTFCDLP
ncbi:hypothetical protein BDQ17DRAFT_1335645 [Cyathus striatus]|nr:hypothetical protein BDQ17DRAFT_1335645 [Cyathus striatus]